MARWSLHHGDCLEWLRTLPSESVDSVVTDPPAGIAFMGKRWDENKGGRAQWVAWLADVMCECLRVLKPGGHALVWSLPRTEHWTACAIEDAGFEIRDGVYHLFAQGWPKSLDVSKAIDAAADVEREVVGMHPRPAGNGQKGTNAFGGSWSETGVPLTVPATNDAKRWSGWGTALKPAVEKWILARKPLAGTVAENVLAHGVGALNIDGCRVAQAGARPTCAVSDRPRSNGTFKTGYVNGQDKTQTTLGRWPSNAVLSHTETCGDECDAACPVRELDAQSGVRKSGPIGHKGPVTLHSYRPEGSTRSTVSYDDSGGASRFFPVFHPFGYFPKAKSASQRGGRENRHPTVKNVELMRWLVRLVTPRGGLVLDAFGGSGTTGVAALLEGCRFVAAEADADSYETARKRLAAAERGETIVRAETIEPQTDEAQRALDLTET